MISQKTTCDVCHDERKDVNHWWVVSVANERLASIEPWSDTAASQGNAKHLCGHKCIHAFVESFMDAIRENVSAFESTIPNDYIERELSCYVSPKPEVQP